MIRQLAYFGTKTLVPEFTIKGPMQEQIEDMATALHDCLEAATA